MKVFALLFLCCCLLDLADLATPGPDSDGWPAPTPASAGLVPAFWVLWLAVFLCL